MRVCVVCILAIAQAIDNGLGRTPPLAWRSWNQFHADISQQIISSAIDAIVARNRTVDGKLTSLFDVGYRTVGIDEGWEGCGEGVNGTQHDFDGFPVINKRFPDMAALVNYAHRAQLKIGWYLNGCACGEQQELRKNYEGDVKKLHQLNFDAVKIDSCGAQLNMTLYAELMNKTGRTFVIENCHQGSDHGYGPDAGNPSSIPGPFSQTGFCPFNFWRTSGDICPSWECMNRNLMTAVPWIANGTSRPGCFAYPDMLEVGKMPEIESRTHFGLWAIISAPLVLGFDLRDQSVLDEVWDIITNREAIAINQAWHGSAGILVKQTPSPSLGITAQKCSSGEPMQSGWHLTAAGQIKYQPSFDFHSSEEGEQDEQSAAVCVDISDSATIDSSLPLRPCNSSKAEQQFTYNSTNGRLMSVASGLCLNVVACTGPNIALYDCQDYRPGDCGHNEKFLFEAQSGGVIKDGIGHCIGAASSGPDQVWTKPLGGDQLAVLVTNGGNVARNITLDFSSLPGLRRTRVYAVRDVWAKRDLSLRTASYSRVLESHGSMFLTLSPVSAPVSGRRRAQAEESESAPALEPALAPALEPGGWDPGLTHALAASAFRASPNYFESCPGAPSGRCRGALRAGAGFYTLGGGSTNRSCRINGGHDSVWTPNAPNPDVPCPYRFSWSREDGAAWGSADDGPLVARAEIDSRAFKSGDTPNLYIGLQENIVVPPVYGGLDQHNLTMVPPLRRLAAIAFSIRAKRCYGVPEASGFGRVAVYFDFRNIAARAGYSVSIDIFTFLDGQPWRPTLPIRRPAPFRDNGGAWHLDGGALGIVPNGTEPFLDDSADCSHDLSDLPWRSVTIPMPRVVAYLEQLGIVNSTVAEGAVVTGGIVLGPETWGRHWVQAEVKERGLFLSTSTT